MNDWLAEFALPAASVAVTEKVCLPFFNLVVVNGEVHAVPGLPSTEQVNLAVESFDENANVGVVSLVLPLGPEVNRTSGA